MTWYKRNNCEEAKKKRHIAKSVKDQLQQKEDSRKCHRSAKVIVKTSAKTVTETKKKAVLCGKCCRPGHNRNTCPLPPQAAPPSRDVDLLDRSEIVPTAPLNDIWAAKYKAELIDWS
jgi:hypothetical protein